MERQELLARVSSRGNRAEVLVKYLLVNIRLDAICFFRLTGKAPAEQEISVQI